MKHNSLKINYPQGITAFHTAQHNRAQHSTGVDKLHFPTGRRPGDYRTLVLNWDELRP